MLVRLALILVTRRWGLIVVGAILAVVGLIVGFTSHGVTYQRVPQGTIAHFLAGDDGTDYLQMDGSSTLYILHEQDFTPAINGTKTFANGASISLIYSPDDTTGIDVTSTLGTHLVGKAFKVVQITSLDNGSKVYATSEYSQNPNGFYQNNWGIGAILLVIGLVTAGAALILPAAFGVRKPQSQAGFSVAPSAVMGMQGTPPQANPYQQPYQNPAQYPQQQQYPQYPQPGQPGYEPTQMANPYNPGQPPSYPQGPQGPQNPQPGGSYEPTQWANPHDRPPQS